MSLILRRLQILVAYAAVILLILACSRAIFTFIFVPFSEITKNISALPLALFNALRFDLQVAAYILIIPTLVSILIPLAIGNKGIKFLRSFHQIYFSIMASIIILLAQIDMGFYHNFRNHINITFFDFFNEGPYELLRTIWQEYHVLIYLTIFACCVTIIIITTRYIENKEHKHTSEVSTYKAVIVLIAYLLIIIVCLRGSVWRFPLQVEDTSVCNSKTINDIVPNCVYMLKKAFKEKSNAFAIKKIDELVAEQHFSSLQQAMDIYTHKHMPIGKDTLQALQNTLFCHIPDTSKDIQPNILIIYGESWSNYLINLDSPKSNMLYGMRKHFKEDFLFRNFQSVRNATIASIENITVSTPFPRFFKSRFHMYTQPSSIALPFNKSGYTTEFISGMDVAWENCAEALSHQQFTKVSGKYTLLKENPHYQYNSVGIYDHHLFDAILKRLTKPSHRPQMILAMTTTSHPPFEFPDDLHLQPLSDDFYHQQCFAEKDKDILKKYIDGYRYYNRALGEFLDKFKHTAAAQNTIVIATGDHNIRSILDGNVIGNRWIYSVPLYLYLPPRLNNTRYRLLTERWGCHDDILPTIASFALRNTSYLKMGNNLLDLRKPSYSYYSYNQEHTIALPAYRKQADNIIRARNLLRMVYFQLIFAEQQHKASKTIRTY